MNNNTPIGCVAAIDDSVIIARASKEAEEKGLIEPMMFVEIALSRKNNTGLMLIGRLTAIRACHDFNREIEVMHAASALLEDQNKSADEYQKRLFTRLVIEPLGVVDVSDSVSEYRGGVQMFSFVFPASEPFISMLYREQDKEGIPIGRITSGLEPTPTWFRMERYTALRRHMAVFGKSGSGKTTLLKWMVLANREQQNPLPMLLFGHPDLALDNPNHGGSKGLIALNDPDIVATGYDKPLQITSDELSFDDIAGAFEEMTGPQRDFWWYMFQNYQDSCIDTLATYDINDDPLTLRRHQEKDPNDKNLKLTVGVANARTIDACCRQARQLSRLVSSKGNHVLNTIMSNLKRGNTVLVNTFDLSNFHQGILVNIILNRLVRAGKESMHKKVPMEVLVLIDEAQHFIARAGDAIGEFCREARKFGVTLCFLTQSPQLIPQTISGQLSSVVAFHLNKTDLKALDEMAPMLADLHSVIAVPPLKHSRGLALVQAEGYPFPAIIKVPHFEEILPTYLKKKQQQRRASNGKVTAAAA